MTGESTYNPQTWVNADFTKPINAARLNNVEAGIHDHTHQALVNSLKTLILQSNGGLGMSGLLNLIPVSGVPDSGTGINGDWAISTNGSLYFKSAGAWAAAGGSGSSSLTVGSAAADHTYVIGDIADVASWYGAVPVIVFQWTPTKSGTVILHPPRLTAEVDGGAVLERDYYVFDGHTINVDYPGFGPGGYSGPDPIANASWAGNALFTNMQPASLTVIAGHIYTIAIVDYDSIAIAGHTASKVEFYRSVQQLGGVTPFNPPVQSAPLVLGDGVVAPGAGPAVGTLLATSELGGYAAADYAHAEGEGSAALGQAAHAEGDKTAARAARSHAEGDRTIAAGAAAHAEGYRTKAIGAGSHAEGAGSRALLPYSHAWAAGMLNEAFNTSTGEFTGDIAQGMRWIFGPRITTNATPAVLAYGDTTFDQTPGLWCFEGILVARRTDVHGTCSAWRLLMMIEIIETATPVIRIITSSATLIAQDAAASTWAVGIALASGDQVIDVTVTGEAAKTIHWVATVQGALIQ